MDNTRRNLLISAGVGAGAALINQFGATTANADTPLPYPRIADTSAASPDLMNFLYAYFAAKTQANVDQTMSFFSPRLVTYTDATLGWDAPGWAILKAFFTQYMANWPSTAKSYPTRILGDMRSAVVVFTDTKELFGGEIHGVGALDFEDGKVVRWVDYWDSRGWPNTFNLQKQTLQDWHQNALRERASPQIREVTARLTAALSAGDAKTAASLFSYDAVYEDVPSRVQIISRTIIESYFGRALTRLPNGFGSGLRHTLGSNAGGGFEWIGAINSGIPGGITVLTLDSFGAITRATTMYDGGRFSEASLQAMAALAIEP
ncbi:nuclear transport factor 2 family protein [Paraburkholderia elongata]|uniref:SnoaL-like domain-containing protein n=1 Tax=Paraburkholderia elongata TaxID=2675747 RepID=A0A972SHN2_9BURK|nr:hypothetical protein [Paraburkholderia elongata]NPT55077.1 hypothetical protein [Paraburkholderia elongata]